MWWWINPTTIFLEKKDFIFKQKKRYRIQEKSYFYWQITYNIDFFPSSKHRLNGKWARKWKRERENENERHWYRVWKKEIKKKVDCERVIETDIRSLKIPCSKQCSSNMHFKFPKQIATPSSVYCFNTRFQRCFLLSNLEQMSNVPISNAISDEFLNSRKKNTLQCKQMSFVAFLLHWHYVKIDFFYDNTFLKSCKKNAILSQSDYKPIFSTKKNDDDVILIRHGIFCSFFHW